MDERCETCEYFCEVKKYPTYKDVTTHVCVYFLVVHKEDYIIETTENDRCECWKERA